MENRIAGDADLDHLFGIKKPFLAPIHLSYELKTERRLSVDEAAQLCERDAAIKPTIRDAWQLAPVYVGGVLHANLSRMTKRGGWHAEATWMLPVAPGYGLLRLTDPLGSGRAVSKEEARQLRSIGGAFSGANPSWTVTPSETSPLLVLIFRYRRNIMVSVGTMGLTSAAPLKPEAHARPLRRPLTAGSLNWLAHIF